MPNPSTLTDTEKAYLQEIIGCEHPDNFASELLNITTAQETILKSDIALWQTVRNSFASLSGGRDGIHSDPADTRAAIRRRVVAMLDVSYLLDSATGSSGTIQLYRA